MILKNKQPSETLDYDIDCRKRMDSSDTITSVNASVSGPNQAMTIESTSSFDDTVAKVRVSGGTDNTTYKITILIVTMNGNTIETEFLLHVKDL